MYQNRIIATVTRIRESSVKVDDVECTGLLLLYGNGGLMNKQGLCEFCVKFKASSRDFLQPLEEFGVEGSCSQTKALGRSET